MQNHETTFHAQMNSILGSLLLSANTTHLTAVCFADQCDRPAVGGLPELAPDAHNPTAGLKDGLPLKHVRLSRQEGLSECVSQDARLLASHDTNENALTYLQADTPLDVAIMLQNASEQLTQYFQGQRQEFTLPLQPAGTSFQQQVWQTLLTIPYGQLCSYGQLASQAGLSTRHGRSVGSAVGRNPISIIIPCHRILSASGTLTGYTGGLHRKLALLELEGAKPSKPHRQR